MWRINFHMQNIACGQNLEQGFLPCTKRNAAIKEDVMANLMTSMYTGVSGLRVNQYSLNVTAHNVANIDTLGFTRQQILTKDFTYNTIGQSYNSAMQVGLGTDMTIIRQVRDIFMDKAYRLEVGRLGFYEAQDETVQEVENLFGELDGVAFKNNLSDVWSAISELAEEPDNIVKRGILVTTSQSFINRAAVISKQMKEYQENVNSQIQEKVDRVNEIGDQIRALNTAIRRNESAGQQANDLRDSRNLLLDELSGLVNCSYKEDAFGIVSVNIEGVQFLTEDHITYMATEPMISEREQQKADKVNELADKILNNYGDNVAAVKASPEWKELKEYGELDASLKNGKLYVTRNGVPLISDGKVDEVLPKQSNFLNVVWKGNGLGDVFRMTGDYNSADNTDVGSIKGLLVARGVYEAKYTDLPRESTYQDKDGNWLVNGEEKYKEALKEYNKTVNASTIMMAQAQFDQLIHDVVTKINDILCPNIEVSDDTLKNLIEKKGGTVPAGGAQVKLADGTIASIATDDLLMLDEIGSSTGMDDDRTIGEALFNRKSTERYTEATLTDAAGNEILGDDGKPIKVYLYNKEYESNNYSLFTIDEIEINEEILQDFSKIPLSYNKYSGLFGGYDMETGKKLMNIWDDKGLRLDPNSLTTYNFADYYASMTSGIAYRGGLYRGVVEDQQVMVSTLDDKRQQVAGVSSDDELTQLIKFQHAYNASSRYINVIDEMLEHIITRLG